MCSDMCYMLGFVWKKIILLKSKFDKCSDSEYKLLQYGTKLKSTSEWEREKC